MGDAHLSHPLLDCTVHVVRVDQLWCVLVVLETEDAVVVLLEVLAPDCVRGSLVADEAAGDLGLSYIETLYAGLLSASGVSASQRDTYP